MSFSDITTKEKLVNVKTSDGQISELFVRPTGGPGQRPQYTMSLESESHKLGYAYFFINEVREQSSFIGMKIEPEFRGKSYGNLLISSYIDLCDCFTVKNLDINQKQRKPEIVHILKNFGYELNSIPPSHMKIILVHGGAESISKLYVPDQSLRARIADSRLTRSNNYNFVESLENQTIIDTIYFGQKYHLVDRPKCLEKQNEVKNCFILN